MTLPSRTPRRGERAAPARGLAAGDLPAIRSALMQMAAGIGDPHEDPAAPSREQVVALQLQLWERERELASASARVAELEAATRTEKGEARQQHLGAAPAD